MASRFETHRHVRQKKDQNCCWAHGLDFQATITTRSIPGIAEGRDANHNKGATAESVQCYVASGSAERLNKYTHRRFLTFLNLKIMAN
jgi:hypothetical protein